MFYNKRSWDRKDILYSITLLFQSLLCSLYVLQVFTLYWTYVGVYFICDSYLTAPCIILMFYQLVLYIVVEVLSYFPHFFLIASSRMPNLILTIFRYSYRYSPVFLYSTNWSSPLLLLYSFLYINSLQSNLYCHLSQHIPIV